MAHRWNVPGWWLGPVPAGAALLALGAAMLGRDAGAWMVWWAAWTALGLAGRPLAAWVWDRESGFPPALPRILGWASLGLIAWLAGTMGVRPLSPWLVTGLTLAALGLAAPFRPRDRPAWRGWGWGEVAFGGLLLAATWYRTWVPDLNTLEKFMDFGLLNACLRAPAYPPEDMWLSGHPVNYYYVGQHLAGFVVRLTRVRPDAGYLLMMATLAALAMEGMFGLVRTCLARNPDARRARVAAAAAAAVIGVGGNLHAPLAGVLRPGAARLTGQEAPGYWFPEATRYIGWRADPAQETIHEFPAYSFAVGDLHAHVLALPLALAQLIVLFGFLRAPGPRRRLRMTLTFGALLGVQSMTSTWDVPIYLAALLSILALEGMRGELAGWKRGLGRALLGAGLAVGVGTMVSLPFHRAFEPIGEGLRRSEQVSPPADLALIWGHGLILTALAAAALWRRRPSGATPVPGSAHDAAEAPADAWRTDLAVLILGIGAAGLVLVPELAYLRDIYLPAAARANTMFKLGYQAFVWWVVVGGWLVAGPSGPRWVRPAAWTVLACQLVYAPFLLVQSVTRLAPTPGRQGLDGLRFLDRDEPGAREAVAIVGARTRPGETVLEAAGDSYTQKNRISAITGVPCPAGWYVHQWLWRGGHEPVASRAAAVREIYTTDDDEAREAWLDAFRVRFIVVGRREWERYDAVREDRLAAGARPVVDTPWLRLYERRPPGEDDGSPR